MTGEGAIMTGFPSTTSPPTPAASLIAGGTILIDGGWTAR
jgi:hypothetical protein